MSDNQNSERKLSLLSLIAVIMGSTIGSGIFTITGDMASSGAHTGAIIIGWAIAGVGMFSLMMCYFGLNKVRPDLTNGIYSYAKEGFGDYVGFTSAWGYWLSALLCNVSYITLLFGAIGYFVPVFGEGNNVISIVVASIVIWFLNWLVLRGVREAAVVNIVTTVAKLIPIFVFIIAVIFVNAFDPKIFMENFWGDGTMSLADQVKATTGSTVWSFIGIEGAIVVSGRAKKSSDVGKASAIGFIGILAIYVMVAMLSLGVVHSEELAGFENPQMAQILQVAVGPWGAALVNIGVILSLAGALLGWTIIAADCPYSTAKQGSFMKIFEKSNKNDAPSFALWLTNGIIQMFLIILLFSASTYYAFYNLSASMIMIPYLLSAAFYLVVTFKGKGFENGQGGSLFLARIFALLGTIYGLWMIYSSGWNYALVTTILYAPGIIVYALGRKERKQPVFNNIFETCLAVIIVGLGIFSIVMIATGNEAFNVL